MKTLRKWATPLTIGTFVIMGVTGVLMFFHLNTVTSKVAHEYVGLVMVAAVVFHLILNYRAFTTYFKRPLAMGIMGLGVVVLVATFFINLGTTGGVDPMRQAMMAIGGARIETLADLAGQDTDAVLARLQEAGIDATADESLQQLAGADREAQSEIMGMIFVQ